MQSSKVRSRLKAQLTKFHSELTEGLSKPQREFVGEMLFGIQASRDVKWSQIARCLDEEIPLIKTEDRLTRNLKAKALEEPRSERLVAMGSRRVEQNTVLGLDLSEVRKEYAQRMEYLDEVWDSSKGEVPPGDGLLSVTAAEVEGSEITPLGQKLFSARAKDFLSENAEMLERVDRIGAHPRGRGVWTIDRGGDRKKLLEPLLERRERFVIRSTGLRSVIDRRDRKLAVHALGARCRLRHQAWVVRIEDGQEKILELRYGAELIRLPGREEKLLLVVVAGWGKEPMLLLSNLAGARDSQTLWWIVRIYLTRWKIEETFRFVKQSYQVEDLRVLRYQRLKNLIVLVTAAAYFAATFLGQTLKRKIRCEKRLILSRRFFGMPPFRFYALADGIRTVLTGAQPSPPPASPPNLQLELLLTWQS